MRQCYQRKKHYPLGKSCRVGGETFSRSRCQSAHDLHWRLSDTSSLFRCGINEARPRGVKKIIPKQVISLMLFHVIALFGINVEIEGGGDWLIVKMLWGWMNINCSLSNYKCFQMKLSEIRRSLPVFRDFFGTTHGKRQTHVTAHHTMFVFFLECKENLCICDIRGARSSSPAAGVKCRHLMFLQSKKNTNIKLEETWSVYMSFLFVFFHKRTLPAVTPATELGLLTPPLIHRDGKKTGNRQPQWMELQNTYLYQPAAETPD